MVGSVSRTRRAAYGAVQMDKLLLLKWGRRENVGGGFIVREAEFINVPPLGALSSFRTAEKYFPLNAV